jgi:PPOX class probable F420-dependent enzyme
MTDLGDFARVAAGDQHLCVVATAREDGTVQASLVNAGVMRHPARADAGVEAVVFVARGGTRKLENIRARPAITVVARSGWEWVAVEGRAELIGPDDTFAGVDDKARRGLLRDAFAAAGGTHDDWDEYDRVMEEDRRTVVLVTPSRVYSNG